VLDFCTVSVLGRNAGFVAFMAFNCCKYDWTVDEVEFSVWEMMEHMNVGKMVGYTSTMDLICLSKVMVVPRSDFASWLSKKLTHSLALLALSLPTMPRNSAAIEIMPE